MNKRPQHRKDSDSSYENDSSLSNEEISDLEITRTQPKESLISPQPSIKEKKGALSDELTEEYNEEEIVKKEDILPIEETEKTITYDEITSFKPNESSKHEEDSNDGEELVEEEIKEASEDSKEELNDESVKSDKSICVLCRNTIEELGIMEGCSHHFCFKCIKHWSEVS